MAIHRIGVAGLSLLLLVATNARADWRGDLGRALESRYRLGKLSFLRDSVKEPGTVLLLAREGVLGSRDSFVRNAIETASAGAGTDQTAGPSQTQSKDPYLVALARFQPVFVTAVTVGRGKVTVNIATSARYISETIDRAAIRRFTGGQVHEDEIRQAVDVSTRRAALVFSFGSADLRTLGIDIVVAAINEVLLPATDSRAPQLGNVAIGMPLERVLTNLGVPLNVISLPDSEVYVYDRIRVAIRDDRVIEVR